MGIRLDYVQSHGGSYGQVFLFEGRVYKVYRRGGGISESARLRTFDVELAAYQIAITSDELTPHIATFHGTTVIEAVVDSATNPVTDRSHEFFLDRCLILDFVSGTSSKFNNAIKDNPSLFIVAEKFRRHGIRYLEDSNVFNWLHADTAKIVDFAVRKIEPV